MKVQSFFVIWRKLRTNSRQGYGNYVERFGPAQSSLCNKPELNLTEASFNISAADQLLRKTCWQSQDRDSNQNAALTDCIT